MQGHHTTLAYGAATIRKPDALLDEGYAVDPALGALILGRAYSTPDSAQKACRNHLSTLMNGIKRKSESLPTAMLALHAELRKANATMALSDRHAFEGVGAMRVGESRLDLALVGGFGARLFRMGQSHEVLRPNISAAAPERGEYAFPLQLIGLREQLHPQAISMHILPGDLVFLYSAEVGSATPEWDAQVQALLAAAEAPAAMAQNLLQFQVDRGLIAAKSAGLCILYL
jgi:hypothetical protein